MPAGAIALIVIAAIAIVVLIVRWIIATISLGKSVVDGVKSHNARKTEDQQWKNLTGQ